MSSGRSKASWWQGGSGCSSHDQIPGVLHHVCKEPHRGTAGAVLWTLLCGLEGHCSAEPSISCGEHGRTLKEKAHAAGSLQHGPYSSRKILIFSPAVLSCLFCLSASLATGGAGPASWKASTSRRPWSSTKGTLAQLVEFVSWSQLVRTLCARTHEGLGVAVVSLGILFCCMVIVRSKGITG